MAEKQSGADESPSSGEAPVVVAVDFTDDSEAAVIWAGDYADRVGAQLFVLHVVHDPGEAPGSYAHESDDLLRPMEEVAAKMMADFLEKVADSHPGIASLRKAETALVKGIPATRILEFAQDRAARSIVMGSRGRTGLPHLLLGSKAERVAQLSPIPVTIVKSDANSAAKSGASDA